MAENHSTEDKILAAAIDLMELKGYKAVTMKEIAQVAGYSEMTLFRRFGTKKAILDAAVEKYSYHYCMEQIFNEHIIYDIEHDLALIARTYQKYMNHNKKIVMLAFQERHFHPEIGEKTAENPAKLKECLIQYLSEMKERGKITGANLEAAAMTFLWMNFGFFMAQFVAGSDVTSIGLDEFIETSVKLFVS